MELRETIKAYIIDSIEDCTIQTNTDFGVGIFTSIRYTTWITPNKMSITIRNGNSKHFDLSKSSIQDITNWTHKEVLKKNPNENQQRHQIKTQVQRHHTS